MTQNIQGIIFGGKSFEHEISIVSAITVSKKISTIDTFIFLDTDHTFYLIDKEKLKAKTFSSGAYKKMPKLRCISKGFEYKKFIKKSIVDKTFLNMVHGADGEDGTLAALLKFYDIQAVGPQIAASAISFDKYLTKMYAKEVGVKVLDYTVVHQGQDIDKALDYPVIVKPLTLGSSIGISVVKTQEELDYALDTAFEFDTQAIIEPFVADVKEYNLAGAYTQDGWKFSMIEEPSKKEFLDFEKKYLDFSRTQGANKADILDNITQAIHDSFKRVYTHYFRGALIRCDFFVIDNEVYLNEINPIPGSMANYLFEDFNTTLNGVAQALPQTKEIHVTYQYINKINASKGK